MSFTYDPRTDRYRSNRGRFVSRAQASAYIDRSINASKNVVGDLAGLAGKGEISPADFRERMKAEIRGEYIRQYLLGRGGLGSMTQSDWGVIGRALKDQYSFLGDFHDDLRKGDLTEAQISNRAQMYISSARQMYEKARTKTMGDSGRTEVRWVLSGGESCADCKALADRGWMEIGELKQAPSDGSTSCKSNCKCGLEFR